MNYYQQCQQHAMPQCDNQVLKTQMIAQNNNETPFCPEEAFTLGNFFSSLYVPYCGFTNFPVRPQNPRQACLANVMMLEFNLHELNLYLDTHPNDRQALDRFHELHHQVLEARKTYEKQYGPLTILSVTQKNTPWVWIDGPWPWEKQ